MGTGGVDSKARQWRDGELVRPSCLVCPPDLGRSALRHCPNMLPPPPPLPASTATLCNVLPKPPLPVINSPPPFLSSRFCSCGHLPTSPRPNPAHAHISAPASSPLVHTAAPVSNGPAEGPVLPVLLSGLGHGHNIVVADEQQGQQAGVGALPLDQHAVLAGTNLRTRAQGVGWRQGAGVEGAGSRAQGAGVKGWRALGSGRRVQGGGGVVRTVIVTVCEAP